MKDQEYDFFYEDKGDTEYCYPGTNILKNKLNIQNLERLHEAERDYSSIRQVELYKQGISGYFSLKHLCSIITAVSRYLPLGQEKFEQLIYQRGPFFVWYSLLKISLHGYISN